MWSLITGSTYFTRNHFTIDICRITEGLLAQVERQKRQMEGKEGKVENLSASLSQSADSEESFAHRLLSMDNLNSSEKALFLTDLLGAGKTILENDSEKD